MTGIARDFRHPRPGRETESVPSLLDAASHRGRLNPRCPQELRHLRNLLPLREGGRERLPRGKVEGETSHRPVRLHGYTRQLRAALRIRTPVRLLRAEVRAVEAVRAGPDTKGSETSEAAPQVSGSGF